jgi:tryptophanase
LRDTLGLDVAEMITTITSQISCGRDMSITNVKKHVACVAMHVETVPA